MTDQLLSAAKMTMWTMGGWLAGNVLAQSGPLPDIPPGAELGGALGVIGALVWLLRDLIRQRDRLQEHIGALNTAHAEAIGKLEVEQQKELVAAKDDMLKRVELVYQSRLQERDDYARQLNQIRQENFEHNRELYRDLMRVLGAAEASDKRRPGDPS